MTPIIPPDHRRLAASLAVAIVLLALVLAWAIMVVWTKGGPRPVHPVVIALPVPASPVAVMPAARHPA